MVALNTNFFFSSGNLLVEDTLSQGDDQAYRLIYGCELGGTVGVPNLMAAPSRETGSTYGVATHSFLT